MNIQRPTRAPAPPTAQATLDRANLQVAEVAPNNKQVTVTAPAAPPAPAYPPKIAKAILAITREIMPVEKAGWNEFHKYHYHKWEDVLEALSPLLAKHGLIIQQGETSHGGFEKDLIEISYEFTIINEDGDVWPNNIPITAICKVRDQKGVIDDKAASKCHTQAAKYMLCSLFKIRLQDLADADSVPNGGQQQRPSGRRPVPSPTGKLPPHLLPVVQGELPEAWATRFKGFVDKAEAPAEIDKWYEVNNAVFEKLKAGNFMDVYNGLLDHMDARAAKLAKPDPISSGQKPVDAFPGDQKLPAVTNGHTGSADIPIALDRKLSEGDRDWLMAIEEALKGCSTLEELGSEQDTVMMPAQDRVDPYAWNRACDIVDKHIERINEGGR